MPNSPSTKDEDHGKKWGDGGKTAKLKASQWCSDNGYYDTNIKDGGGWRFYGECSNAVPNDWSRPFSDEAARENGFSTRNHAAIADCKKKGYDDINAGSYRDKGNWNFSLQCTKAPPPPPPPPPRPANYSPSTKDEDHGKKWGDGGKTAKLKASQWCSDKGYYDTNIKDAGDWRFYGDCSNAIPNDWSRPFSDEAAKENGFGNRNDAAKADCIKKGYDDIDSGSYRDKGNWNFSLQCTPYPKGGWADAGCQVSTSKKIPGRHYWTQLAVGNQDWQQAADSYARQIIGKTVNGQTVIDALGRKDGTGAYVDIWTQDSNCDVKWDPAVSGCDGAGSRLSIRKCNNWVGSKDLPGGDANSCLNSPSKPNIVQWINCAIGSSPGGIAQGDGATACSPLSSGPTDFKCIGGQNCFAVINSQTDSTCPNTLLSNPLGALSDSMKKMIMYIAIFFIVLCIICIIFKFM